MFKIKERLRFMQGLNRIKWTKKKIIITALLLIGSVSGAYYYYRSGQTQDTSADLYTVPVQRGIVEFSIDGTGPLYPSQRYALKTLALGTVEEIMVTEGYPVEKGQPLMQISNDELSSQARQAALEWEIAQYDLESLISPEDYDRRAAELKVEQYEITLKDLEEQKEKLVIKAPFNGTVLTTDLQLGQRVNSGIQAATIASSDQLEVVSNFSEVEVASLRVDMDVQITGLVLNRAYQGKIKEISPQGTVSEELSQGKLGAATTYEVIISIDDPDEKLLPGMRTFNTVTLVRDMDQDVFLYKQAPGYIRYIQTEKVLTEVNGTVAEIIHRNGEKVQKGEPIYRLVNEDIDRQVKTAENELVKAEEDLNLLLTPNAITIKQQELKVEQSYQKVLAAGEKLDSLIVLSPIKGVISDIAVIEGDVVMEEQEIIVVSNFSVNSLEIAVDELDINKIKFGQQAVVTVDALPGTVLEGKVIGIAQEGTSSDGVTKFPVTLEVGNAEGIKGSMTATATILLEKRENVLRIPAEALINNNGRYFVRVKENEQPLMKPVKIGLNSGRWVEITEGLQEGEQIIVAMAQGDADQQRVPTMRVPGGFGGGGGQRPQGR